MQFILEVAGYGVTTAEDGREALEKIAEARDAGNPVDLLITDVQMPRLTGLELMDELICMKIDIPVLAITGYGTGELLANLMAKGCKRFLNKPVDDEELVECVAAIFEEKE